MKNKWNKKIPQISNYLLIYQNEDSFNLEEILGEDFRKNHLAVYLTYFGKDSGYHSIANSPNSFYGQLLGEYGLTGIAVFVLFYFLPFAKGFIKLTYGVPVLFIMMGALVTEYWFEQLSIVVLFELLILLNRREISEQNTVPYER